MLERKPIFPNIIEVNHQLGHVLGCNVYVIYDGDQWIMIDIGYEDVVDEVIQMIRDIDLPFSGCQTVIATCLLYTSPSPRDATLSRMPSSA